MIPFYEQYFSIVITLISNIPLAELIDDKRRAESDGIILFQRGASIAIRHYRCCGQSAALCKTASAGIEVSQVQAHTAYDIYARNRLTLVPGLRSVITDSQCLRCAIHHIAGETLKIPFSRKRHERSWDCGKYPRPRPWRRPDAACAQIAVDFDH
jgi:hypothetical protein